MKSKLQPLLWFVVGVGIILSLNVIADKFFFRIDLTEDKKYSLAPSTKKLLDEAKEPIMVEVYLAGDLPPGFKRLQSAVRETLEEFRAFGTADIEYSFIDPSASSDRKVRSQTQASLQKKGVLPTNLMTRGNDKVEEKLIFPGAIIRVKEKEIPVLFLKGNQSAPPEVRLNQSVEGVEYELATGLKKALAKKQFVIGYVTGHKELNTTASYDLGTSLQESYSIRLLDLPKVTSIEGYDAVIVAKPDSTVSDFDKYKLDQYVVKGGNLLLFIDPLKADIDSIQANKQRGIDEYLALPSTADFTALLFPWGLRVNKDVIQDINSGYIKMIVGQMGNQPQMQLVPWAYYPLINVFGNHPIVKNMDALYTRFPASIDSVKSQGITKTPLLMTSQYSRIIPGPARLSFEEVKIQPSPKTFTKSFVPIAWLLEGKFKSGYTFKTTEEGKKLTNFKEQDKPGKVLVVADGDFVRNDYSLTKNTTFPMGFDRQAGVQFGNKDFVLNAVNYMLDPDGVILAKSKDIQLRPLDKPRIAAEKSKWQTLSITAPLALMSIILLSSMAMRKRHLAKLIS